MIDCMACLVKVARGCPTRGEICAPEGATCAEAAAVIRVDGVTRDAKKPAHSFSYNEVAECWVSFEGALLWWARESP